MTASNAYLEDVRPYYAELTLRQASRDLRTIERDLGALRKTNRIHTTNPNELTETDIGQVVLYWRTRPTRKGTPLDVTSQTHLVKALGNLLDWVGNPVMRTMRRRKHVRFPRDIAKPIRTLTMAELERIRAAVEGMDGWEGSAARFLVAFVPATGLRPKEIAGARLADLDLDGWTVAVSHPKGEGAWAAAGDVAPILPFAQQAVFDYLDERRRFLGDEDHEALLPYRRWDGTLDGWPPAMLRKLIGEMRARSGVRFSLKTFRATFGQLAIDAGARVEAVSRAMRHASTKTTERYYARVKSAQAFSELRMAFEKPTLRIVPKSP